MNKQYVFYEQKPLQRVRLERLQLVKLKYLSQYKKEKNQVITDNLMVGLLTFLRKIGVLREPTKFT